MSQVSGIVYVIVFVIDFVFVFLFVIVFLLVSHVPSSLWSNVSNVTSLWGCTLKVFSKCICLCLCLCICLCHCLFVGQAMSLHHSDQMSQMSQDSGVALWMCSRNIFVFVIVLVTNIISACGVKKVDFMKLNGDMSIRTLLGQLIWPGYLVCPHTHYWRCHHFSHWSDQMLRVG